MCRQGGDKIEEGKEGDIKDLVAKHLRDTCIETSSTTKFNASITSTTLAGATCCALHIAVAPSSDVVQSHSNIHWKEVLQC